MSSYSITGTELFIDSTGMAYVSGCSGNASWVGDWRLAMTRYRAGMLGSRRGEHDHAELDCLPALALSHQPQNVLKAVVAQQCPDIEVDEDENVEVGEEIMEEGEERRKEGVVLWGLF